MGLVGSMEDVQEMMSKRLVRTEVTLTFIENGTRSEKAKGEREMGIISYTSHILGSE